MPLLEVKDLCTEFRTPAGTAKAVDRVSFSLEKGKILGIVGESGSGKSVTAFSLMNLVDPPGMVAGGEIRFNGEDLMSATPKRWNQLRGNRIAMIFQDPMMSLNPVMKIGDQLAETVLIHRRMRKAQAEKIVCDALRRVGIPAPEERMKIYPHEMSGGMRQRVAIANALINEPDLIIADEPTTALDVTIQAQILYEMRTLARESGTALIWITHDLSVVKDLVDELCVMYAGRIVEHGPVDEVIAAPRHPYTRGLIDSLPHASNRGQPVFHSRRHAAAASTACGVHVFTPMRPCIAGLRRSSSRGNQRYARIPLLQSDQDTMNAMLQTQGLTKSFTLKQGTLARAARAVGLKKEPHKRVFAVNDVSLSVKPGEVLGLVGESGCGKSTYGRMVAGLLPPTAGSIQFNGSEVTRPNRESHLNVQMIFQNPYASLNPRMRIEQLISEGALYHGIVEKKDVQQFVGSLLKQVGLDPVYANRFPHQFSGGQRQRIAIARAMALDPKFVVCDEAVSALDVSVQAQILNLFMDLRTSKGLTYLFISHNLSVVEYIADRVAIMYLGRIVEIADTTQIFKAPNHPYTQALIADAPRLDVKTTTHRPIQGELPSPLNPPSGCAFHPRCPHAMARCKEERPALAEVAPIHLSACHLNTLK